jgi:membrane-associated phospholipid phosphatase
VQTTAAAFKTRSEKKVDRLNFIKKYKHGFIIIIYGIFYMAGFRYLENHIQHNYHIVHAVLDDYIPFCEYFIIPYLLWFPFLFSTVVYFIFFNPDKQEYYQYIKNLCMGMTVFLAVSYLYPNGHQLRPEVFARDNFCVDLVKILYSTDTCTNILPSIHVFNSLAAYMAVSQCQALRKHTWVKAGTLFLVITIILSTMLLKQHSVVDVILGSAMAGMGYLFFYQYPARKYARQVPARFSYK